MNKLLPTALITTLMLTLAACSGEAPEQSQASNPPDSMSASKKSMPEDPDLKSLYTQSCFSCHGTGAGGAPRTGTSEWDSRMAKGMDTLIDNTINGYNGMPPLGMCMDCGEEEFEALILFMAGQQ
ncbi:cytochrome c5 [Litorivivens lipolytica]|uniref:Cytochrome c5 n=1 Tax=Litorivivens lipolytica TaxID=1524264 RepID=A0A7W4W4X1_9GAMM|nr:c-type cytochrome [Litorivivens lipolytica]MBB3047546.1 cytochrome c5 [Litorivivens lipolytica]